MWSTKFVLAVLALTTAPSLGALTLPRKVIYIDIGIDWGNPHNTIIGACQAGYNVVNMAFFLERGPFDMALAWEGVSTANKQMTMDICHALGAVVMVSYGGATETPYNLSPVSEGQRLGNWVVANMLDGIDFDMEHFGVGMVWGGKSGQQIVQWLIDISNSARAVIGPNRYISHAPQAPYFGAVGAAGMWPGATGGYTAVYAGAPHIDFLNVQFYNQGATCYTTETGLFTNSNSDCRDFPGTSVGEIASYGIPASKIVVGKYMLTWDASNGFLTTSQMAQWLPRNANGGVMVWQWHDKPSATSWIQGIYGVPSPTAPTTKAPTLPPSPTPQPTTPPPTTRMPTPPPSTKAPTNAGGLPAVTLPRRVIYVDSGIDWNNPHLTIIGACQAGYNVVIMAFYLAQGPFDMLTAWESVSYENKRLALDTCHSLGAIVMASYGGATESPYLLSAQTEGQRVGNWVVNNMVDGIDFDLENILLGFVFQGLSGQQVVQWLIDVSNAARAIIGPNRQLSHAPQAPYFGPVGADRMWPGVTGGYTSVYLGAPHIDFFNVQFYNQGGSCYTTEAGLFTDSNSDCRDFPGTSVGEIVSYGIPASKIVVGKYMWQNDASDGFLTPQQLNQWLNRNSNGGVMVWQWHDKASAQSWISGVYAGLSPTAPTIRAPTSAPVPTMPPSSRSPTAVGQKQPLSLPRKVIYIDIGIDWSNPHNTIIGACQAGYNVVIMAFMLVQGPYDMLLAWESVSQANKQLALDTCHNLGAIVMVSYGGATEAPYLLDPISEGQRVANWAVANMVDGIDFDMEWFGHGMTYGGKTGQQIVQWLVDISDAARAIMGPRAYISHAPQAPYFGPVGSTTYWPGPTGGYVGVYNGAPHIDFFNIQYYNQGGSCYTTEAGIFTRSASDCAQFPGTSVGEIVSYGIPASKLVVGKYLQPDDASDGWTTTSQLNQWLPRNVHGGVMVWQWHDKASSQAWISAIYPAGSPTSPPSTKAPSVAASPTSKAPTSQPTAPTSRAPTSPPSAPTSRPPTTGGSGCGTYTIVAGDSFYAISLTLGISLQSLVNANPQIPDVSKIQPGMVINLPCSGTSPTSPSAAPTSPTSRSPTRQPTLPTPRPTLPTARPTPQPTASPTPQPTVRVTASPTLTRAPTLRATSSPTRQPTRQPTVGQPACTLPPSTTAKGGA